MSEILVVFGPVLKSRLNINLGLLRIFHQTSHVRMLFDLNSFEELSQRSASVVLELEECMVDSGYSLLGYVPSHTRDEEEVVDPALMGEVVLDDPDFLSRKEDPTCIEQQIEGVLGQSPLPLRIVLGHLSVEMQEVLVGPSEKLEFNFIADFGKSINPIHCSYNNCINMVLL